MATHLSSWHFWQSTLQHQWKVQLQGLMLDFRISACPLPQQSKSQEPLLEVLPMRQTRPDVPAESILGSASQKLGDLKTKRYFNILLVRSFVRFICCFFNSIKHDSDSERLAWCYRVFCVFAHVLNFGEYFCRYNGEHNINKQPFMSLLFSFFLSFI